MIRLVVGLGTLGLVLFGSLDARATDPLIGIPTIVTVKAGDTLMDIGRTYDVGFVEMREANPGVDPLAPAAGTILFVPTQHVLPAAPRRGIVINLAELRLYYFGPSDDIHSFPIGTGDEGKATPVGSTKVVRKQPRPSWIPTASEHAEEPDLPAIVAPGPDNPMGEYALYLGWTGYAIHGTNKPDSIGRRGSHGCIRLYPEDIAWLYRHAAPGTAVTVINQPAKLAWSADELYLEVHPMQEDLNSIELTGKPQSSAGIDADDLVLAAAGAQSARLDWYAIHLAEARHDGVPVQITAAARPVD